MPAVAEPPAQKTPPVQAPPVETKAPEPSFSERMAQARSESQKVGGVDGEDLSVTAPLAAKESQLTEKIPEAKTEEVKSAEVPKTESKPLADAIAKIKEGRLEEKPEAKTEEKKVDLSKLTKEQKEAYTYRQLNEEAAQAKVLREELEGLKGKLNGTDIDTLRKELDDIKKVAEERQQKLAAVDVTQSPKYQNEVAIPLKNILEELQATSKDFGYSWKEFVDAMEQPTNREREAALSKVMAASEKELNPLTQLSVLSGVNEYLQRQEFGKALIQDSIPALEAMKREEKAKADQFKKQAETDFERISGIVFDHVVADDVLKEEMPFLLKDGKLDDDKAKSIRAAATFGEVKPEMRALQAYSTILLPLALEDNKSLRKTLEEREERISQLSGISPSTKQAEAPIGGDDADSKLTLQEKIAQIRRKQGQ